MRYIHFVIFCLLLLAGCAQTPGSQTASDSAPLPSAAPEIQNEPAAPDSEVRVVAQRPFPADSFYSLLVAEFALRRRDYDQALQNYTELAPQLRDPAVSARATRLAQYMRDEEAAIAAARLWVELEPAQMEAHLMLANLLARRGQTLEALPHMVALTRAGGAANYTALATGFEQLSTPQKQQLLNTIDQLRLEQPQDTQLMICKALLLENLGQTPAAIDELQAVFAIDTQQLQAIVLEAKLKQDMEQYDGLYDRIIGALEDNPDNGLLRMQYARLLTRTDLNEARSQFTYLLERAPEDHNLLLSVALIEMELGNFAQAQPHLEALLQLDARPDEAHLYLGRIAEQQQRFDDALAHYKKITPAGDFGFATGRIAALALAAGKQQELSYYFAQLRQQYPRLREQLYAIEIDSLTSTNRTGEALQTANVALLELPNSSDLQYMRSMLYEAQGNLAAMERDMRLILERDPDNATVLNALGYTLADHTDRLVEAELMITRALQLQPDEPAIIDSMGWVKYRLGELEEALTYLQRAYALFPDPEVAAHYGEVLWVSGDKDQALQIWRAALLVKPGHALVIETMRRLGAKASSQ
jgi:tetratricopeptide (TPR) repeat protein